MFRGVLAMPIVSVIIPTYNSAKTIDETLQSIAEQTFSDWEAIVFDDGSKDTTAQQVESWCARDSRFRFFYGPNRGVSSARNRAVRHTEAPWLLFLDSDDLIHRDHLRKMLEAAGTNPSADLLYANGARLTSDGNIGVPEISPQNDYFKHTGSHNPFYTHACLLRRDIFNEFGGFDETLVTCEDWDLWQRLARAGSKFAAVNECLAFYRMRRGSLTRKPENVFIPARTVILRGHGPDPRVRNPLPENANGLPFEQAGNALLGLALWAAAVAIGEDQDVAPFLNSAELPPIAKPDVDSAVSMVQGGVPIGAGKLQEDWPRLWPRFRPKIHDALMVIEERCEFPDFSAQCMDELERRLSQLPGWREENSLRTILTSGIYSAKETGGDERIKKFLSRLKEPDVASVMVIAAHPDDELIGAGGHLRFWPRLSVVHVTNGSPRNPKYAQSLGYADSSALANTRRREVENSFALIGVSRDQLVNLGFDDQDASFCISGIAQRLCELFSDKKPEIVVTHAYEGGHPDHDATCCAVHAACRLAARSGSWMPALIEMSSYFGRDGIRITSSFCTGQPRAITAVLDEASRRMKRRMLECHASQQDVIRIFPVGVESFRPAPEYDFSRLPLSERLLYEDYDLGINAAQWREAAWAAWRNMGLDKSR